ncbi:MAG: glycosyltransferase [Myxococcales bacterium]|nr:glycosyltransferase [Myxococcales bacterium]
MPGPPTVLHGKFSSWLPWHQPFLADLLAGLDADFRNVVLCNRLEHPERFPRAEIVPLKTRALLQPTAAAVCAADLQRRFEPALLHGHFGWSGIRMLLLKAFWRVPLLTTFGGRDAGVQLADPESAPLYEILLGTSDHLVCVSEHLRGALIAGGADPARTSVIHRGTDLRRFAVQDRPMGARGASLSLLMIGRVVAKKGHRDALEALGLLRDRGVAASLTIVGEGPEQAALEGQVAALELGSQVRFAPSTDQTGLLEHLRSANAFVHCSVTAEDGDVEGIPNVVVEAAATGLPVVGTRHGGIPEVVEDGATGFLVPEGAPEALAEALSRLAESPEVRVDLGRAAAARMRRDFDLAEQVARYGVLYRELIEGGAPLPVSLPPDFLARVRSGADVRPRPFDATLVRAAMSCVPDVPLEPARAAARRGALDRALEATTGWPRPWRSAAELASDLVRSSPIGGPLRAFRRRSVQRAVAVDEAILARLRAGNALAPAPEAPLTAALADLAGEAPPTGGWRKLRGRIAG